MRVCVLHNCDHELLDEDPGREAREDVVRVAAAIAEAARSCGVQAELVPVNNNLIEATERLRRRPPDLVFNICESLAADSRGEMAIPCLLELLQVPYTGSSGLSLGLALHKHKAKELLVARGITTPEFRLIEAASDLPGLRLPFPLIVKPSREDASTGIDFSSVVHDRSSLAKAVSRVLRSFRQPAVVERYIEGREIYVPLLGNQPPRALPLTEIRFGPAFADKPKIVSYRAKWEPDAPECIDSAPVRCELDPKTEARVIETAKAAFAALECRDYGRVDLRLDDSGVPSVIDINPNCDLHPEAGFARAAFAAGMSYAELVARLIEIALERTHGDSTRRTAGSSIARRVAWPHRDLLTGRGGVRSRAHRSRA